MSDMQPDTHRYSDAEDLAQLRRVAAGDVHAFEALYLRYHRRLSRFLMRFVHQYGLAEEVINDTMFAVWRGAAEFEGHSRVSTWVMSIAYRRAMKVLRRLQATAQTNLADAIADDASDPAAETRDWIAAGLARLPLEQRMALELAYFFGYSCEEIAAICGCSPNAVKTRMFYARRRLRELLPRLGDEAGREIG